jgi:hypothetical protein
MKKTLIGLVALILLGVVAWALLGSHRTTHHSYTSVRGSILTISSASGLQLTEVRTANSTIRSSRYGMIARLFNQVSGRPLCNDTEEFVFQDGTDTIHVTVYHSLGIVGLVKIRPNSMPSKQAEALRTGLTASFPDLECYIDSP